MGRVGLAVAGSLLAVVLLAPGSTASSMHEARVAQLVNETRTGDAVDVVRSAELDAVASRHARRMADAQRIFHNSRLGDEVSVWEVLGENVGRGLDVDSVHRAFLDSPSHRANIVEAAFTELGVGVAEAHGALWIVQVFRQLPPPRPAPVREAAPAVAAPSPTAAASERTEAQVAVAPASRAATPVVQTPAVEVIAGPVTVEAPAAVPATAFAAPVGPAADEVTAEMTASWPRVAVQEAVGEVVSHRREVPAGVAVAAAFALTVAAAGMLAEALRLAGPRALLAA